MSCEVVIATHFCTSFISELWIHTTSLFPVFHSLHFSLVFPFSSYWTWNTCLWRPWMPSRAPSSSQESQMGTWTTRSFNCLILLFNQAIIGLGLWKSTKVSTFLCGFRLLKELGLLGLGFWPFQRTFRVKVPIILGLIMGIVQFLKTLLGLVKWEKLPLFYPVFPFFLDFFKKYKCNNKRILQSKDLEKVSYFVLQ